jgi:YVTN family beta-propeller protein
MLRPSFRLFLRPWCLAVAALVMTLALVGSALAGAGAGPLAAVPELPSATRGPVRIAFSADGALACVVEEDEGTLAVFDARTFALKHRWPTGGRRPSWVATVADTHALVSHPYDESVVRLDLATGRREVLRLPGAPGGIAADAAGRRAYVALSQLDEVAVIDLPGWAVTERVPVGDDPHAVALTPDGRRLLAANRRAGTVSVIDTGRRAEERRIALTGINLRDIAVSPDGARAFVTGQIPANTRATDEPLDIWTNTLFVLNLHADPRSSSAEGWLDFSGLPAADPDGVAVLGPEHAVVAASGSDLLLSVRTRAPYLRTYDPIIEQRLPTPPRPRGLAVSPDRRQVWVASEAGNQVTVFAAGSWEVVRRLDLGLPSRRDPALRGRYLFGSALLASGGQFSCNSCHPDGGSDGLRWEFVHVPDGVEFRNSRDLRGGVTETAPFRWSGREKHLEEFLEDEVGGLLRGPKLPAAEMQALKAFLATLEAPPNPHRAPGGRLTATAAAGQALFEGKAGCLACHAGPRHGGTGQRADVGTTDEGRELDVPHLAGVHAGAPYLHDGRARTLAEVFTRHNAGARHGHADRLTEEELAALLRYLAEL